MEDILYQYVSVITIAFCYCVGIIIKKWIKDLENKWIPTIVAILGVGINVWVNMTVTPETIIGGLVSGLASCGVFELYTHVTKKKDTTTTDTDNKEE